MRPHFTHIIRCWGVWYDSSTQLRQTKLYHRSINTHVRNKWIAITLPLLLLAIGPTWVLKLIVFESQIPFICRALLLSPEIWTTDQHQANYTGRVFAMFLDITGGRGYEPALIFPHTEIWRANALRRKINAISTYTKNNEAHLHKKSIWDQVREARRHDNDAFLAHCKLPNNWLLTSYIRTRLTSRVLVKWSPLLKHIHWQTQRPNALSRHQKHIRVARI